MIVATQLNSPPKSWSSLPKYLLIYITYLVWVNMDVLDLIVFCRFHDFYKFKVCGIHVYGCHFSNSICSLRISVSHYGILAIFWTFIFIIFVFMICDQWSLKSLIWLMEGSDNGIFSNKNLLFLVIFWCGPFLKSLLNLLQ